MPPTGSSREARSCRSASRGEAYGRARHAALVLAGGAPRPDAPAVADLDLQHRLALRRGAELGQGPQRQLHPVRLPAAGGGAPQLQSDGRGALGAPDDVAERADPAGEGERPRLGFARRRLRRAVRAAGGEQARDEGGEHRLAEVHLQVARLPETTPAQASTRRRPGGRGAGAGGEGRAPRFHLPSGRGGYGGLLVRLLRLRVAFPALHLDLDALDRHRVGVRVQVGDGGELADPAAVEEVALAPPGPSR